MECVCLGELRDEEPDDVVECLDLRHPHAYRYNRNHEFFKSLNLGGLYEFVSELAGSFRLNYLSTGRPTRLQNDSSARRVWRSFKGMFARKRRRLSFDLHGHGAGARAQQAALYLASNFDFFVDEKRVTVVTAQGGGNLRVTIMSTEPELGPAARGRGGVDQEFEPLRGAPSRSLVLVTGKESLPTTLCVNDLFGFGFELFAGFADGSVAFFRVNTSLGLLKGADGEQCSCANVGGFLYLDEPAAFSSFSPNRELVLVGTASSLYLLERSGFDLEYEKLCGFRRGSLVCAQFLNDFEVMVMEDSFILSVYKKCDARYKMYIRYNLLSVLAPPHEARAPEHRNHAGARGRLAGSLVKDRQGSVYLLLRNMDLVKLTWNETLIPYSSTVSLHPPSNFNSLKAESHKGLQRLLYNLNVESNVLVATFAGSNRVHLYSLSSLKELDQLRPPRPDYLPKHVRSASSSDCCFLLVLWTHVSHFNLGLDAEYRQPYERSLHHPDLLRTYRLKSSLTKAPQPEGQFTHCPAGCAEGFEGGLGPRRNGSLFGYEPRGPKKLPLLSSLHPKLTNPLRTRLNDFGKFEGAFGSRRHLLGRSLSDHSLRLPHETIYSIDEFIRNRGR